MPITGRKLFKDSLLSLRGDLPAGTLGVNFHQTLWAEETMEPVLTKMVRESAQLNSDPVTYTKSWSSKPCLLGKRFNLQFKVVLHKCFLEENPPNLLLILVILSSLPTAHSQTNLRFQRNMQVWAVWELPYDPTEPKIQQAHSLSWQHIHQSKSFPPGGWWTIQGLVAKSGGLQEGWE